jgi:O-antigen ligase
LDRRNDRNPATGGDNGFGGGESGRDRGLVPRRAAARPIASWGELWREERLEATLLLVLIAALAWAPFWLGGNRPLAWGVNAILFPGLVLLYELAQLLRGRPHPVGLRTLAIPAGLFAAVVVWIFIQMSTLAPPTLQHPIWAMAADTLEHPVDGSISVNRDLTALALLRLLTAASAFWISLQLCARAERAELLIRAVGVIVAAYALYGLISYALFSSAIFWFDVYGGVGSVRSTFVNRNSFATYAGLGLIATTGALLRVYRREAPADSGAPSRSFSSFVKVSGRRGWLLLAAALITLVALVASASRGGIAATALGLFALLVMSFSRDKRRFSQRIEEIIFATVAVVAGFFFFGDILLGRIASEGFGDVNRLSVYLIVLQSILDNPFLGFGAGTFAEVFPMYRDRSISVIEVWDHAHNSYLDIFQGLGLVFGAMLIGALGFIVAKCLIGAFKRRRHSTPASVASAAAVLAAVHALVDFGVEMQGVTVTLMALLGAGFAQAMSSRENLSDSRPFSR